MSGQPLRHSPIEPASDGAIRRAADALRAGRLVAFPTETVYGLGADAANARAVAAVFAAKERPRFNPLIAHVPDAAAARRLAVLGATAEALAAAFWPGPLTLVLPARPDCPVDPLARAGLDTVAVRAPAHPVARDLLAAFGGPVVAPSANRSGRVSPTEAGHVASELDGAVALILEGRCAIGVESTIVDVTGAVPVLLRPGGIPRDALTDIAPALRLQPTDLSPDFPQDFSPKAPGQLASHYAPSVPVRLGASSVQPDEALLAFGPESPTGACETLNLSERGDLEEAASHLFAYLRRLDRPGRRAIAVMPIPPHGLGEAINDRLVRAAAPRRAL